jgi:hypothetical protein
MPLRPGNWPPSHCMPPPGPIGRLRGTRSPQEDLARSFRSDIRPRKGRPKANPQMRNDPPYKSSGRRACKGLLERLLLLVSLLGRLPPCLAARGVAASTTTSCGDPHSLDQLVRSSLSTRGMCQPGPGGGEEGNGGKGFSKASA